MSLENRPEENSISSSDESLPEINELEEGSNVENNSTAFDRRSVHREQDRVKRRTPLVLGVTAALLLTAGTAVTVSHLSKESDPAVPAAMTTATSSIGDSELCEPFVDSSFGCNVTWVPSSSKDRGSLLTQSIAEGETVEEGTTIDLTYSSGPATSEMPNLNNKTLEEVEEDLYNLNVSVNEITEVPGGETLMGRVVSSSVEAGTKVDNGSTVDLVVSSGKAGVPDWSEKTREFVETDAQKLGIDVNFIYEESEKASDLVLSQTPAAGEISKGDRVDVTVSKSFESREIKVPDVIGKSDTDAQTELATAGFRHIKTVTVTNSEVTSSQVTQVVPGVGQMGKSEENIVIIVSNPAK